MTTPCFQRPSRSHDRDAGPDASLLGDRPAAVPASARHRDQRPAALRSVDRFGGCMRPNAASSPRIGNDVACCFGHEGKPRARAGGRTRSQRGSGADRHKRCSGRREGDRRRHGGTRHDRPRCPGCAPGQCGMGREERNDRAHVRTPRRSRQRRQSPPMAPHAPAGQ